MMPIPNKHSAKSSSLSEEAWSKSLGLSKLRSHTSKMSMRTQEHVAYIMSQILTAQQYASRCPANPGYLLLCLDAGHTLETCTVVTLELHVVLLQQCESNKNTKFGIKTNAPSRERSYYRASVGPSAYHLQVSVPEYRKKNPPTPSRQREGSRKTSIQIN